ncbi:phosphoheptose isomerase [Clostridia bacterium]|nr:phosphoheptose isomerase [Clostridia bacterium]
MNKNVEELTIRYPALAGLSGAIEKAIAAVYGAQKKGGKILLAGCGGSAADCDHIAGELLKEFKLKRRRDPAFDARFLKLFPNDGGLLNKLARGVRAVSLTWGDGLNAALVNDVGAEVLFAQKVYALAQSGDVLLAISTSGNSATLLAAAKTAKAVGCTVVALTGRTGGQLKEYADILLNVAEDETYKVQELHLPVYHCLCAAVEELLFS